MKNKKKTPEALFVIIFMVIITEIGILFYALPNKPTVSESENRVLAGAPEFSSESLFSGEYTTDYNTYYSDNFPFREQLIGLSSRMRELLRPSGEDDIRLVDVEMSGDMFALDMQPPSGSDAGTASATDVSGTDANEQPEAAPDTAVDDGVFHAMYFVADDRVLSVPSVTPGALASHKKWADMLNTAAELFPEQNIYCTFAPLSSAYYLPKKYRTEERDQRAMLEDIYTKLNDNVHVVDIYDDLALHSDEYIYFRTDHHWTALGAYYAYECFAKQASRPLIPELDRYAFEQAANFKGTYYSQVGGSQEMRDNPDRIIAYDLPVNYDAAYYYESTDTHPYSCELVDKSAKQYNCFLCGDRPLVVINTDNVGGGSVLLVKDSYGNPYAPYLAMSYEHIIVADPRSDIGHMSELIEKYDVSDVIFLYGLDNTTHGYRVSELRRFVK